MDRDSKSSVNSHRGRLVFRALPWEYATRNLFRRPVRTGLTLLALTGVILMVLVVVGFLQGLLTTLRVSGDPRTALVFSLGMGENLEYSSIPLRTGDLVGASVEGIEELDGRAYISPELYLGTDVRCGESVTAAMGLVRGVTSAVTLVRGRVELEEGNWPEPGEVLVGQLAAAKLGVEPQLLDVGQAVEFEGRKWRISGVFSASGAAFESELWCRLDDLQQAMKRQDLSLVAVTLRQASGFGMLDLFCKQRLDLELQAIRESDYYERLQSDYQPVITVGWLVAGLVSCAGMFVGLNTMYGAVVGRVPELAMLQTVGFSRRAVAVSLIQEGVLLSMTASLAATFLALLFVHETSVRFTMGAFALTIDTVAVLAGCLTGLLLGVVGTLPPVFRALRKPIQEGLQAV